MGLYGDMVDHVECSERNGDGAIGFAGTGGGDIASSRKEHVGCGWMPNGVHDRRFSSREERGRIGVVRRPELEWIGPPNFPCMLWMETREEMGLCAGGASTEINGDALRWTFGVQLDRTIRRLRDGGDTGAGRQCRDRLWSIAIERPCVDCGIRYGVHRGAGGAKWSGGRRNGERGRSSGGAMDAIQGAVAHRKNAEGVAEFPLDDRWECGEARVERDDPLRVGGVDEQCRRWGRHQHECAGG